MDDATWQAETYGRFLMVKGGAEDCNDFGLLQLFSRHFPDAKRHWEDRIVSRTGVRL